MSTTMLIGTILGAIFVLLSALHVLWACGFKTGMGAVVPEVAGKPAFVPSTAMTLAVAFALALAAWTVLAQSGVVPKPFSPSIVQKACGFLGILFILRAIGDGRLVGFLKKSRDTRFARWDTLLYSPLCVILGAGSLWLAQAG